MCIAGYCVNSSFNRQVTSIKYKTINFYGVLSPNPFSNHLMPINRQVTSIKYRTINFYGVLSPNPFSNHLMPINRQVTSIKYKTINFYGVLSPNPFSNHLMPINRQVTSRLGLMELWGLSGAMRMHLGRNHLLKSFCVKMTKHFGKKLSWWITVICPLLTWLMV